jgi:hypothetical protein
VTDVSVDEQLGHHGPKDRDDPVNVAVGFARISANLAVADDLQNAVLLLCDICEQLNARVRWMQRHGG